MLPRGDIRLVFRVCSYALQTSLLPHVNPEGIALLVIGSFAMLLPGR